MTKLVVLIPHYNNNEGLLKSIASIDENIAVDILVVDDGSLNKPNLNDLKEIYSSGVIFLELLQENKGIENALNKGLEICKNKGYEFIGRLDCCDLNKPNKYKIQLDYLEANKSTALIGTWADMVNEKGEFLFVLKHPCDYETIKKKMYFNSMFVHPSVVFRSKVLDTIKGYPEDYKSAEDFAFFFEIMKKYKIENIARSLITYEINPNSISSTKRKQQVESRIRIILKHFYFGYYPIVGVLRNLGLWLLPRQATTMLKRILK